MSLATFFFLFICFLLQGKNILCALFLAGLLKWGCEFNFLLVGSFLLSTKVEFLVLIYISLVFSVSSRNLEYAAVNNVLFFYAIATSQLVNFLCM